MVWVEFNKKSISPLVGKLFFLSHHCLQPFLCSSLKLYSKFICAVFVFGRYREVKGGKGLIGSVLCLGVPWLWCDQYRGLVVLSSAELALIFGSTFVISV